MLLQRPLPVQGVQLRQAPACKRIPCRGSLRRQLQVQSVATPERTSLPAARQGLRQKQQQEQLVFVDEKGERIPVMTADYGFRSGSGRLYQAGYGTIPASAWELGLQNFKKELRALRRAVRYGEPVGGTRLPSSGGPLTQATSTVSHVLGQQLYRLDVWLQGKGLLGELAPATPRNVRDGSLSEEELEVLLRVEALELDDAAVTAREKRREKLGQKPKAPFAINLAYGSLCWLLDRVYEGRPIQRFWFLETVARMPYFAYISMLHLYESLGWWRAGAELRKVHFAEEWNELHHLQIMEALGGDQRWVDRFLSEHAAVFYYWVLVVFYLFSPKWSYCLMELIEGHAADTYAQFAEQNRELLLAIPPPLVALNYYKSGDLYLFDEFQTGWKGKEPRRPPCNNLYDVFINIRDDEVEHTKTMRACQDGSIHVDFQNLEAMQEFAAQEQLKVLDVVDASGDCTPQDWLTSGSSMDLDDEAKAPRK